MVARLFWEQEVMILFSAPPRACSTPRCPTQAVVEGWLPLHG